MTQAIAFLWGLAEATAFFIVPDVWISYIAVRRGWRAGLLAACLAGAGALIGGAFMYQWGNSMPETAGRFLDMIPAISPRMIWMTRYELGDHGLVSMVAGAFAGVPFKIYAAEAGAAGTGLGPFLGMAVVARLGRFVLGALIAAVIARSLRLFVSERTIVFLLAAIWTLFYAWYFTVTG